MLHFRFDMPFYLMSFYGSIMILVVLLFRGLLKNRLPKFVFPILWSVVLLRLLLPFSISSPLSAPVPSIPFFEGAENLAFAEETTLISEITAGNAASAEQLPEQPQLPELPEIDLEETADPSMGTAFTQDVEYAIASGIHDTFFNIFTVISGVYLLGAFVTLGVLMFQKYRCAARLKNRLLLEQNETINEILREMKMGHVLVFSNDEIASPLVCGLLNPCIYLPTRMNFGNTALLRHILAHETMHIKRKDNWLKALMLAALCLHWYNPLVWIMAKCLSSDLEAACDAAVLKNQDTDYRKGYASSLLTMAITGNRSSLLYSSFSKTEVEKRIRSVLNDRKAGVCMLLISVLFLSSQTLIFATACQGPFSTELSSYCASDNCRFGVKAELTRDIFTGSNAQKRADKVILDILSDNTDNDSEAIGEHVKAALSKEFGVEKSAFALDIFLCLDEETKAEEYRKWEITEGEDGFYLYKGETIRTFQDSLAGFYQSKPEGQTDLSVNRNRFGEISSLTVFKPGDTEYDLRTRKLGQHIQNPEHDTALSDAVTTIVEEETVHD